MWTIYLLVSSLFAPSAFPLIFTIENKVSRLKKERQTEHQNEEECSKNIEQNSNKNNVNDSGRKPKGQSNKNNGKSGSIKASDNEASMRKEQNNLGQSSIKSFTTPASKLKSTSQHTPPTPLSREEKSLMVKFSSFTF
jgi:hypothetical protein